MSEESEEQLNIPAGNATAYDESAITHLDPVEHIRHRPGMYIGKVGDGSSHDDGIYVLLKEVIDNSIDEFIMGYGRRVDITVDEHTASVRDFGRGIPLEALLECVSQINTGGKLTADGAYGMTIGLNGVGTKAVNFLSVRYEVTSVRNGKFRKMVFERGRQVSDERGDTDEKDGTKMVFTPDPELFKGYSFRLDHVEKRLWMFAYLNSGLSLYLNGANRYYSKNGLLDLVEKKTGGESLYKPLYYRDKTLEFSFTHTGDTTEKYYSFVNGQYTIDGGTHLSALKEGILRAINEFSGKDYEASDIRDGIVGTIAIKIKNPLFEAQTKTKLGNPDIRSWIVSTVKQAVVDILHRNPDVAALLQEKVQKNVEIRKEIQSVRKKNNAIDKKLSVRNSKLRDSKYHFGDHSKFGEQTMIFLTEGDSAGGSMAQSRNSTVQAVFPLRGKPYNCFGVPLKELYKNEELYYIMRTLDIEEDLDNLRYNKVVIATDADVDGLHIRNLLITFFLTYFEQLVATGHLYILQTPLFRVRNKKETYYCYTEEERDSRAAQLGKSAEITRFKGLGEINPSEMKEFIGENIRLDPVNIDHTRGLTDMLRFYMGDNTPERWEHIVNNLV